MRRFLCYVARHSVLSRVLVFVARIFTLRGRVGPVWLMALGGAVPGREAEALDFVATELL